MPVQRASGVIAVLIFGVCEVCFCGAAFADEGPGPWEAVYAGGGVTVVARKQPGSKIKEIRAVGEVAMGSERLFAVLGDIEQYPRIMPPTIAAHLLAKEGTSAWYHLEIDPPVVSKRDYCIKVTLTRLPDGKLQSEWHDTNERGCPPLKPGYVRMRGTFGRWLLTPLDGGRTFVDYQAYTDPAGSLPAWAVNRATARQMGDMFKSLVKAAAEVRYAACRGEKLGCDN